MTLFLMMAFHVDSGTYAHVGIYDNDDKVSTLLVPPSFAGIDGWLSMMAFWFR